MGTTGERINRRCCSEHQPATMAEPIRCNKGQGHSGPHTGTRSIIVSYEWVAGGDDNSEGHAQACPLCYECGQLVPPDEGEQHGRSGWCHVRCMVEEPT